jgi:hypothetical protein
MEPITMSLVAVVSIVAASTHRPRWEELLQAEITPSTMIVTPPRLTTVPLIERRSPAVTSSGLVSGPKDRLFQELMTFFPNGDEDASLEPVSKIDEILAANELLRKLPGSISLPTLMRNDSGHIGMYWDNDVVYLDIDVDTGSTVSLYARNIETGEHSLLEDISIEQIDTQWFDEHIGKALGSAAVFA